MTTDQDTYTPVSVHLKSIEAGVQLGQPPRRKIVGVRPYTVVLTASVPVDVILPANDKRLYALVQAGGNDVILSNAIGEAQNSANQAAGLPNPIGFYLPFGNTTQTKIPGGQKWWASAAQYPAQVTVLSVEEE